MHFFPCTAWSLVPWACYILTLWFLPSFAHYFKKLSAALDSIRVNLNSVEESLTFNALILSKHGLAWFREHVHPNFNDSYHLSPIILRNFQQLWTAKVSIWRVSWRKCELSMHFLCPCTASRGSEDVHPNFMILTIFRPLFYETFSSFGQHKNRF